MPLTTSLRVRLAACVLLALGASTARAADRFTVSADGQEVRDSTSRLSWRRCAEGAHAEGASCVGKPTRFSFAGAKKAAEGSGGGWRVPTREELVGLVDKSAKKPKFDAMAFPKTPSRAFWASRAGSSDDLGAWLVSFPSGKVFGNVGQAKFPLRLVRAGS